MARAHEKTKAIILIILGILCCIILELPYWIYGLMMGIALTYYVKK